MKIINKNTINNYDLVFFSSATKGYNKMLYCNILSFLQNCNGLNYKICIHQINADDDDIWLQKIKNIRSVDIIYDYYKGRDLRFYCIKNRFCFLYECLLKYKSSKNFLFLDADLIIKKPLLKLIKDFNEEDFDICTKKRKISNKYRALGIQLMKNNERVVELYKQYYNISKQNDFHKKSYSDWHVFMDLEKLGHMNKIKIGDFSKIRMTDYIPFLHGGYFRRSEQYKNWMDEIIK